MDSSVHGEFSNVSVKERLNRAEIQQQVC